MKTLPYSTQKGSKINLTSRQKEILSTTLNIIAMEGTKGLTLKKVAESLEITDAAIYKHFKNKRHLMICLYDYVNSLLISTLSPIIAENKSARKRLCLLIDKTIDYLIEHRGVNLILLAESIYQNDEELRAAMLSIFYGISSIIKTLLLAGITAGEFKNNLDVEPTTICLIGMIQGALTRYMLEKSPSDSDFNLKKMKDSIKNCFFDGINSR